MGPRYLPGPLIPINEASAHPGDCFGQIRLNYSAVGNGAEEPDDSVREHKASLSAAVYDFNSILLTTAGTRFLTTAVQAKG